MMARILISPTVLSLLVVAKKGLIGLVFLANRKDTIRQGSLCQLQFVYDPAHIKEIFVVVQ